MIKHVLLVASLIVAVPVIAAQQQATAEKTPACQSVKELSAITMATAYSVPQSHVDVTIKFVLKQSQSDVFVSGVETTYLNMGCYMEWRTPVQGCQSELADLFCQSKKI